MPTVQGQFLWYDLMTDDVAAARRFYGAVIGWSTEAAGLADRDYTIVLAGGVPMGGMMALPDAARAAGAQPEWSGYVAVPEVDDFAARFRRGGGTVHRAAEDIPGVGRFAIVADPQGAPLTLFRGNGEGPPAVAPGAAGHVGWHELHTSDPAAAMAFYAGMFGWTAAETMDMKEMGTYHMFAIGGRTVGGMMTANAAVSAPPWLFYINVAAIDAAGARVTGNGGRVTVGPKEVPGGQWIVHCVDPQGAQFALVALSR